jgi:hypothetical protein
MRDLGPELERRAHLRHRPQDGCEVFVGAQRHTATVLDASAGGLFIQTDAPLWPAALVRVRHAGCDRFAIVVHQRLVPQRLRALLPGGVGLRWVRAGVSH